MIRRAQGLILVALLALGCAPSLPRPYQAARAAAERSYAHGRYAEAARHWEHAATTTERRRDIVESHYRAAVAHARAGNRQAALGHYRWILESYPKSSRAARAAFNRAELHIAQGEEDEGYQELDAAIQKYPDSGLAAGALSRVVRRIEEREGAEAAGAYLHERCQSLDASKLAERLHYTLARHFEARGQFRAARDRYLYVAKRFPYPHGALWDDALFRASEMEEKLRRPRAAIAHLQEMLAEREPSHLQGSYQRPRFAAAQYRIATLYRDALGDPARAQREFVRVWAEHTTSILRDDALWQAAKLAHSASDDSKACDLLQTLKSDFPESRFVPCSQHLCPSLKPASNARCRGYLLRELRSPTP